MLSIYPEGTPRWYLKQESDMPPITFKSVKLDLANFLSRTNQCHKHQVGWCNLFERSLWSSSDNIKVSEFEWSDFGYSDKFSCPPAVVFAYVDPIRRRHKTFCGEIITSWSSLLLQKLRLKNVLPSVSMIGAIEPISPRWPMSSSKGKLVSCQDS